MGRVDGCSRCDSELDGALGVTMANDGGFMGPQWVSSGVCATSGASTTVEAKAHVGGVEHGGSRGGVPARRGRERAGGIERGKRGARRGEKRSGVELLNREVGWCRFPQRREWGGSRAVARGGMTGGPAWRLDARCGGAFGAWAGTTEKVAVGLPNGWAARGRSRATRRSRPKAVGKERWLGGPRDGPGRERGRK